MENNNPPTYIIEHTEEPSVLNLMFGTASGETFKSGNSDMPCITKFDFNINLN